MLDRVIYIIRKVLALCFYFLPVKDNKIAFINFNGRGYGCNPKYIAQEILERGLPYDLVWLVNNPDEAFPQGIRKASYGFARGIYELSTAKVIVVNVKNDLRIIKKKSQYVIQTWHGSYSAKRLEQAAADTLPAAYLRESEKNSRQTDLFLSNSRVLSDCYRSDFWCTCEIMECGFPRNDILFRENETARAKVRQWLGVPEDSKLAMYAPTFRDDGSTQAYGLDCRSVLNALQKEGENWRLLIRMHPNVASYRDLFLFDDVILDATGYPDMQELLVAADVLITDYSSTVFEFAAMKKPVYLFTPDIQAYQKLRGLMPAFFEMPYPRNETNGALCDTIGSSTPEKAEAEARRFIDIFGSVDNGTAAAQVTDRIVQVMDGKL